MSDTPRTDAKIRDHVSIYENLGLTDFVDADFARQIERENVEAYRYAKNLLMSIVKRHYPDNKDFAPLDELLGVLTQIDNAYTGVRDENAELKQRLAEIEEREAACCPEDVGFDEYIEGLKDIIKQMRYALRVALPEARSTHCEKTIAVALKAAERGGE